MNTLSRSLLAAGAAICLLSGCGDGGKGKPSDDKPSIAFITNNPDPWWNMAEAGARAAEAKVKFEVLFRKPADSTPAAQKEEVENAINAGAKAVAVSVIDPKNQSAFLDQVAGKAHVLAVDNDAPKSKRVAYIGTDNYAAGRAVGKLVKEALGEKGGTVAIFVGRLDSLNARQRRQGVIDELFGNPALTDPNEFKDTPDGESKGIYKLHESTFTDQPVGRAEALTKAENFINALPEGNVCMVGLWAYNPPACLAAASKVKDAAKRARISIVGFDEDPATLDGITAGTVHGTVVQDPYEFGYQAVMMMAALSSGQKDKLPAGGIVHVPYRVIQKDDGDANGLKRLAVGPFRKRLAELMSGKK